MRVRAPRWSRLCSIFCVSWLRFSWCRQPRAAGRSRGCSGSSRSVDGGSPAGRGVSANPLCCQIQLLFPDRVCAQCRGCKHHAHLQQRGGERGPLDGPAGSLRGRPCRHGMVEARTQPCRWERRAGRRTLDNTWNSPLDPEFRTCGAKPTITEAMSVFRRRFAQALRRS